MKRIWAERYAAKAPELDSFAPFTSGAPAIDGSRALAETLALRTGGEFPPANDREPGVVVVLTKQTESGQLQLFCR